MFARYRAYDSVSGRWLSPDPLGEGVNTQGDLYNYVGNSPINAIDPLGLLDINIFSRTEWLRGVGDQVHNGNPSFISVGGHGGFNVMEDSNGNSISPRKLAIIHSTRQKIKLIF